jgi:hypothetical protein
MPALGYLAGTDPRHRVHIAPFAGSPAKRIAVGVDAIADGDGQRVAHAVQVVCAPIHKAFGDFGHVHVISPLDVPRSNARVPTLSHEQVYFTFSRLLAHAFAIYV